MMNRSAAVTGNWAMILYVVLTALSSTLIHHTTQTVSPLLSAFYTFVCCVLVYGLLSKNIFLKMQTIRAYGFEIAILNVTTAICWVFTFLSLTMIPPELYLFAYLCAMPIAASVIHKTKKLKAILLTAGLALLFLTYPQKGLWLGFSLAFLGGVSGTVYSMYSKKITPYFSTFEILSLRFYLTVVLTLILSLHLGVMKIEPLNFYLQFSLLSLVAVILPLAFFQVGLKHLSLARALSYVPLAPLLCYFLNVFVLHAAFKVTQLLAVILLSLAMMF
jgi:drug/metabolite transporter (DMT)-like permease